MNRLRELVDPPPAYAPLPDQVDDGVANDDDINDDARRQEPPFSWLEYVIFLLLGISMLWAWNMFLAAAPYFHHRFESSAWALRSFQSSILAVSTATNLVSVLVLAQRQDGASYPRRIIWSLITNIVIFSFLALSAVLFTGVPVGVYFVFLMLMVFGTSLATGMNQNGVFAYVSGFGRGEYTQAIMAGQGIAGVLPCIVQIASVLVVPEKKPEEQLGVQDPNVPQSPEFSTSAFAYFITATGVSGLALASFLYLARSHRPQHASKAMDDPDQGSPGFNIHSSAETEPLSGSRSRDSLSGERKPVPLWHLFRKLRWMAMAVYLTFAVTIAVFPVFTAEILTVRTNPSRIFQAPVFIPLAFLFWNIGDLLGRVAPLIPFINLTQRPWALFTLSAARVAFLPLYLLCNVRGYGAVINSDAFYLIVVQLFFGLTNGYLGSSCMMGAGDWVDVEEREAAGGFMSLMLVAGLATGSVLSFLVSLL